MNRKYKIIYWVLIALSIVFAICDFTLGHIKDGFYMLIQAAWLFLFMAQSNLVERACDLNNNWCAMYMYLEERYKESQKREQLLHKQVAELRAKSVTK